MTSEVANTEMIVAFHSVAVSSLKLWYPRSWLFRSGS